MTDYDPDIIQEFADRLYSRATQIVIVAAIVGALLGLGAGFSISRLVFGGSGTDLTALVVVVLGGVVGYLVGRERSFILRLQAQTALCQVRIEKNTRSAARGPA